MNINDIQINNNQLQILEQIKTELTRKLLNSNTKVVS